MVVSYWLHGRAVSLLRKVLGFSHGSMEKSLFFPRMWCWWVIGLLFPRGCWTIYWQKRTLWHCHVSYRSKAPTVWSPRTCCLPTGIVSHHQHLGLHGWRWNAFSCSLWSECAFEYFDNFGLPPPNAIKNSLGWWFNDNENPVFMLHDVLLVLSSFPLQKNAWLLGCWHPAGL